MESRQGFTCHGHARSSAHCASVQLAATLGHHSRSEQFSYVVYVGRLAFVWMNVHFALAFSCCHAVPHNGSFDREVEPVLHHVAIVF